LLSTQTNDYSITKFTRKIKICDKSGEDLDIEQGTPHVIFAWSTTKPTTDMITYHDRTNRDSKVIPLISSLNLKVDLSVNQLEKVEYYVNVNFEF